MTESISHCLTASLFDAGVFVLREEDVSYTVGRAPDRDVSLPSNRVSRNHARLYWSGSDDSWFIEDVGSRNGTRVEGVVIRKATPLADRDLVEIGPFQIRYRQYQGDLGALMSEVEVDGETIEEPVFGTGAGISGTFQGQDLIELCQFLAFNGKNGLLAVRGQPVEREGKVLFTDGKIGWAEDGEGEGIGAAHRLLSLGQGTFEFRSPAPPDVAIKASSSPIATEGLLMEIARQVDENAQTWDE